MSDLIERLEAIRNTVAWHEAQETLNDAIAALSPVLPDEVAELVGELSAFGLEGSELTQQAADLIKRLARENANRYENECRLVGENEELQKRIEELKKELRTAKAQRNTAYGYGQDGGEPPWMK